MSTPAMSIRCAHCKGYHESIAKVRECASTDNAAKVFFQAPTHREFKVPPVGRGASGLVPLTNPPKANVPDGHYAVEVDGVLGFYRVHSPTEGKWVGRTFVDQQVSDDYIPTFTRARRNKILHLILEDPAKASVAYGHMLGRCGVCNRTLTNEESRAAGIGPVCRAKFNV